MCPYPFVYRGSDGTGVEARESFEQSVERIVGRIVRFLRGNRGRNFLFLHVRFSVKSDLLELGDLSLFYRCYVPPLHRVNDKTTRVYVDDRQECELFNMQIFSSTTQVRNSWTLEIKIQTSTAN